MGFWFFFFPSMLFLCGFVSPDFSERSPTTRLFRWQKDVVVGLFFLGWGGRGWGVGPPLKFILPSLPPFPQWRLFDSSVVRFFLDASYVNPPTPGIFLRRCCNSPPFDLFFS